MVGLIQPQLLAQAHFVFAQRGDPSPNGGDILMDGAHNCALLPVGVMFHIC